MNHHHDMPPPSPSSGPTAGPAVPPDRPHGLDPRALLEAVAAPTGGPDIQPHQLPDPSQLATSFPQLEIGECLGRGGMGVVYRARQRSLNRPVALKLLAPERGHNPTFAARFAREAQALAKLNHPNIVTIHDFGQAGGFYYLLMEFVDGVNLRQAMQAGRFTPEQALAIVPPVCDALHYAHSHGLVHRDIKPENLLLDKDGRIKIADFGIAKMLDADAPDTDLAESQPAGTPRYMAPEQRDASRRTDHRADIYSLGVVLYELLTGEVPGSRLEPPSRRVQIDVRLDEIVLRALEAEPERRYQTAVELRTCLEDLGAAAASTAPPPRPTPAKQTSSAVDSAAEPNVLRAGQTTVTTPARLATASGQFFHYRNNRHQLVLDESRLTIAGGTAAMIIPLASIRDLSLGRFPRTVNPAGLELISITFADSAGERQVLLAPIEGGFLGSPASFNTHIHAWWTAIRDATVAATGQAPSLTPPSQLGLPGSSPWLTAALLVPLVIGISLGLWLLDSTHALRIGRAHPATGPGLATVVLLTLAALTPILGAGRREKSRESWSGTTIGLGAVLLAAGTLLGRPGFGEVVILGAAASFFIHWLKNRAEPVPGPEQPAAPVGPTTRRLVFAAALGLTVLFASPHYSVLGTGNIMVWEVGLPAPWITDTLHVLPGGGQQRVRDMHLDRPSFYLGFAALASWMLWLRLQAWHQAWHHGAALFEVIAPATSAGERPRVRWGTLASVWMAMAALSVIALLLVCVFMRAILGGFPEPAPLLVMAVFPVSLVVLNGLRLGLRQARAAAGTASPAPRLSCAHGCLWLAAFLVVGGLILVAVWSMTLTASHDPRTPPAPHSAAPLPATAPAPQ